MAEIKIEGVEDLERKLGAAMADKTLHPPMVSGLSRLHMGLATYPDTQSTGPMVFKSDKQRRYFFWALREGIITVPYGRTGTLGRRWTTTVRGYAGDMVGLVGNNTSYGPLVQGAGTQTKMHKGNWQTDEDVMKQEKTPIVKDFAKAIEGAMGR